MPTIDEKQVIVVSKCKRCGVVDRFELPKTGFDARSRGVPIMKAFEGSPEARIIQMIKHVCPSCQEVEQ